MQAFLRRLAAPRWFAEAMKLSGAGSPFRDGSLQRLSFRAGLPFHVGSLRRVSFPALARLSTLVRSADWAFPRWLAFPRWFHPLGLDL